MGKFLVSVKLKHDSLDELQNSNNALVTLGGLIFDIPYHIGKNTISSLSVNNHEHPFQVLLQNLLYVNELFYFSVHDSFLYHS